MGRGYSVNDVRLLSRLAERARVVAGNWYSERRARSAADFFFQAEDGIRDLTVTRVQTCALPISSTWGGAPTVDLSPLPNDTSVTSSWRSSPPAKACSSTRHELTSASRSVASPAASTARSRRSEERRVGKECRSRWSAQRSRKKVE